MADYHKDCQGEIVYFPTEANYNQLNMWSMEHWVCQRCKITVYSQADLEKIREPPLTLRWLTDKETGRRFASLVTDPQMGTKYEY